MGWLRTAQAANYSCGLPKISEETKYFLLAGEQQEERELLVDISTRANHIIYSPEHFSLLYFMQTKNAFKIALNTFN